MPAAPLPLSAQSHRTADSPISYFVQKAIETPGLVSLAAGLVDETSLPAAAVRRAVEHVLSDPARARAALQYGSTQGLPSLRAKVLDRACAVDGVTPADVSLDPGCVVLTTGSQQMLYLLGETLFEVGDVVICEAPSYFVYHDCLKARGVKVHSVPMDAGGMDLDALDGLLARLKRDGQLPKVRLVYTVDYFQNPTGLSLAADRRPRLVEIVKRYSTGHRILVLEDAAYRELRYDVPDVPSVKSHDATNEFVVYTSTFSKPCSPGLKTGFSLLPKELVKPVCNLKGAHDFGSNNLSQHVIDRLIATGEYDEQVKKLRPIYRSKRDAMLTALDAEFADWPEVRWTKPGGGMFVWLTFPPAIDAGPTGPLVDRALEAGVLYIPGQFGHVADESGRLPRNEVRLSFGVADEAMIVEGVRRLRRACRGLEGKPAGRAVAAV